MALKLSQWLGACPVVVCLCLLAGQKLPAQRYSFMSYGPDEGLTAAVNRLLQDREGFLWMGTSNGVVRYDGGEHFQHFGPAEGLPGAQVSHLRESPDGTLWGVTGKGLARLRQNRFERVDTVLAEESEALSDLDFDARGRLYLGTVKGLLIGEPAAGGVIRSISPMAFPESRSAASTSSPPATFGSGVERASVIWRPPVSRRSGRVRACRRTNGASFCATASVCCGSAGSSTCTFVHRARGLSSRAIRVCPKRLISRSIWPWIVRAQFWFRPIWASPAGSTASGIW